MNNNGLRLLSLCSEHSLTITNTIFQMKDKYKTSWMHPRSKHWHLIDYVILRQQDRKDVIITRVMRGAECSTDHKLIISKLKLFIRPKTRRNPSSKKLNYSRLKDSTARNEYRCKVAEALSERQPSEINSTEDLNQEWIQTKDLLQKCAEEVLGLSSRQHKDWFDDNAEGIHDLLAAKNKAHNDWLSYPSSDILKATFQRLKRESQKVLREMEDNWWIEQAKLLQHFADSNDQHGFYNSLKTIFGPRTCNITPVRTLEGVLLKDKGAILNRWAQHFDTLLNQRHPVDATIIDQLPDAPITIELDLPPTFIETVQAIKSLKNNKSPGPDNLPGELYKEGGYLLHRHLHNVILAIWRLERPPSDFLTSDIITIYKKKGDRSVCDNSRGITLLIVASKILTKIMLSRLSNHLVETIMPETQCGFRKDRSTCDMIFVLRQIQEKCVEHQQDLYVAFIDLAKAFDTVNRDLLWLVLAKFGVPPKFLCVLKSLHENMTATVRLGGDRSSTFPVEVGVKQGCVLAPVIFNIYLTVVTLLSHQSMSPDEGITIQYRLDGSLFNIRRLQALTKTSLCNILELQYADDCAIIAHSPEDLQNSLTNISRIYNALGLKVNINKTEIISQRINNEMPLTFQLNAEDLKQIDNFCYLGSIITDNHNLDKETYKRINQASLSFGKLRSRVFDNNNIKIQTKVSVYTAVCLSNLLYSSETWTPYRRHIKQLEAFHIRCLQRILGITWRDKIPHSDILHRAHTISIEAMLANKQLRWTGHVIRMPEHRLPRQVLYSQLPAAPRRAGGQKKRYKDVIKTTLKRCNIRPEDLEALALDRPAWRSLCGDGINYLENNRNQRRAERRQRRHNQNRVINPEFTCQLCGKICGSRIGLHSHARWHQRQQR